MSGRVFMADSFEFNSTQIETIIQTLNSLIDPWIIILFGSYAKGGAREESDVDIAFLTDQKVEEYQSFCMAQRLARILTSVLALAKGTFRLHSHFT